MATRNKSDLSHTIKPCNKLLILTEGTRPMKKLAVAPASTKNASIIDHSKVRKLVGGPEDLTQLNSLNNSQSVTAILQGKSGLTYYSNQVSNKNSHRGTPTKLKVISPYLEYFKLNDKIEL